MARSDAPIVVLQDWLEGLERSYVEVAVRIARAYEQADARDAAGAQSADRSLLEQIETDIPRARRAIELCRKLEI